MNKPKILIIQDASIIGTEFLKILQKKYEIVICPVLNQWEELFDSNSDAAYIVFDVSGDETMASPIPIAQAIKDKRYRGEIVFCSESGRYNGEMLEIGVCNITDHDGAVEIIQGLDI